MSSMYEDIMAGNGPNLSSNNWEHRYSQILMNNSRLGWSLISKYWKAESYEVKNLTKAVNPFDVFVIFWRDIFDLLPAGVNCLGVWSLFKSQVFSPQFFICVFYQVLQLKCHCFYDGSAYQGKCYQTELLKYVNF